MRLGVLLTKVLPRSADTEAENGCATGLLTRSSWSADALGVTYGSPSTGHEMQCSCVTNIEIQHNFEAVQCLYCCAPSALSL